MSVQCSAVQFSKVRSQAVRCSAGQDRTLLQPIPAQCRVISPYLLTQWWTDNLTKDPGDEARQGKQDPDSEADARQNTEGGASEAEARRDREGGVAQKLTPGRASRRPTQKLEQQQRPYLGSR